MSELKTSGAGPRRRLQLAISALTLTLSSGCAHFVPSRVPPAPYPLVECAKRASVPLPPGPWSRADAEVILAQLIASEAAKGECAAAWAAWHEALRRG